ncbi:MAG: hypothetical protein LBS11_04835 [Oscillospiraceae bacterium]|jgi:phenylpyruvate tautomerase PptA (4-oxalocrotonate tautomerase family)|nr:hypothetical protein [Oscillospiraceae bacterium]
MPFLSISVTKALSPSDKQCLAAEAGRLISLINGKSEEHLMVKVEDSQYMTFGGCEKPCAFIETRVYTAAPFPEKQAFAQSLMNAVTEITGIPAPDIFMTVTEHNEWGSGGAYR